MLAAFVEHFTDDLSGLVSGAVAWSKWFNVLKPGGEIVVNLS